MYGSNLHICSTQFGPPRAGTSLGGDSFPFSCFSCQTQLNDHIKQIEIHLLEGDMKELLLDVQERGVEEEGVISNKLLTVNMK